MSYLQLVEVAFVATVRHLGVPLERIRRAHAYLESRFSVQYPFAQLRLKTDGVHILKELEGKDGEWVDRLVAVSQNGQLVWQPAIAQRIREFQYDHRYGWAVRWYPRGPKGPVMVDPRIAFGAPVLRRRGLPTWIIKQRHLAGETFEAIREDYGVSITLIREALDFEGVRLAA